jgi:hypothetical protein
VAIHGEPNHRSGIELAPVSILARFFSFMFRRMHAFIAFTFTQWCSPDEVNRRSMDLCAFVAGA